MGHSNWLDQKMDWDSSNFIDKMQIRTEKKKEKKRGKSEAN